MTINEALSSLLPRQFTIVATNRAMAGSKESYVEAQLVASREVLTYDTLRLTLFLGGRKSNSWDLVLTDEEHATGVVKGNPRLSTGGYWWKHTGDFYNYAPVGCPNRVQALLRRVR